LKLPARESGRAFVFGDNITTDALAPGAWMKFPIAELAKHCLATDDPDFARAVRPGDFVVGGENFGMGSSREQAVMALVELGVRAVVAKSFAGLFFRNCINLGLYPLVCAEAGDIRAQDELRWEPGSAQLRNATRDRNYAVEPFPEALQRLLDDGGLIPHLKRRFAAQNR
jgi:3-isopropylmalate/(R)-2-methylmalate dehydratase small subunit